MCGIGGWFGAGFNGTGASLAAAVAQALRHRGPDANGVREWPDATLIHTRLSIIDLSPAGVQPMSNEDGSVWVVFNGEIYNHHELRRGLEDRGHQLRGSSDTEVLTHLYEEEGAAFVGRLRGMFAIAIYDFRNRTLVLARDRFGIKPLFYAPGTRRLAFASELNALRVLPEVDTRLNRQAVYDFAMLTMIPAPQTVYRGVFALEPGQLLRAQFDGDSVTCSLQRYHNWTIAPDSSLTLGHAVERAAELMESGVQSQMESDVPLGAFLSGGIDSALVSTMAQRHASGGIRTFNVRFSDAAYDETWAAKAVARHIGSTHLTLDMPDSGGDWDTVTGLLRSAGQPFGDTSLFPSHAVCKLMREHVTVALSGDGGDEGYGGYNQFWHIGEVARLQKLPTPFWRAAAFGLGGLARLGVVRKSLSERTRELAGANDTDMLKSLFCALREVDHRRLCRDEDMEPVSRLFEPHWECNLPEGASRLERLSARVSEVRLRMHLPDRYLFKVDLASMRNSLEVRVPLLDEEFFAFGLTLPHELKVTGRTCKRVLREVAARQLPAAVAEKPKHGFDIPVDQWVGAEFKARLRETLLGSGSRLPEVFQPDVYRPWVEAFCTGERSPGVSRESVYRRTFMLLTVQLGLEGC